MKLRSWIAAALLLGMATFVAHADQGSKRIVTYVLSNAANGHLLMGDPADSLAAGATMTTNVVQVYGARMVQIMVRDSVLSAGNVYTDSMGTAQIQFSMDETNWTTKNLSGLAYATTTTLDSIGVGVRGSLANIPLQGVSVASGGGYTHAFIMPARLDIFAPYITMKYMRLNLVNISRGRGAANCSACAANIGLKVKVIVIYDGPEGYVSEYPNIH